MFNKYINFDFIKNSVIAGIILVLITGLGSLFFPGIKSFFGFENVLYWRVVAVDKIDENHLKSCYVDILNKGNKSGKLVVVVEEPISNFVYKIEGNKDMLEVNSDDNKTYLNFNTVYPGDEIAMVFGGVNYSLSCYDIKLTSDNLEIEETYDFPYNKRNMNFERIFTFAMFLWILYFSITIAYLKGLDK